jgi:hypothetical protein
MMPFRAASTRFDRFLMNAISETKGHPMHKLSVIADRIKGTKAKFEVEADKLAAQLDRIEAAFDRGHAFLAAQAVEVGEIEDTLQNLSNLPLEPSATDSHLAGENGYRSVTLLHLERSPPQAVEVGEIEDTLQNLSNLPLEPSATDSHLAGENGYRSVTLLPLERSPPAGTNGPLLAETNTLEEEYSRIAV